MSGRMTKIYCVALVVMFVYIILMLLAKENGWLDVVIFSNIMVFNFLILVAGMFFFIISLFVYAYSRRKKTTKKFVAKYDLEKLDNTDNNVYVIKKFGRNGIEYMYTYVDNNSKSNFCNEDDENVIIDISGGNYVEIFEKQFNVGGFLDYLYFDEELANKHKLSYSLHVSNDSIKILDI